MGQPITAATRITLTLGDAASATTLGRFLEDNEGADVDPIALIAALCRGEVYRGGGGAAPEWSVELTPDVDLRRLGRWPR